MINMNEIEDLKSQIALLEVQLKSSKQDVEMLKFELKAADSVNEGLSKANEEIIELLEGNGVTNTNWILNRLKELTNQNK